MASGCENPGRLCRPRENMNGELPGGPNRLFPVNNYERTMANEKYLYAFSIKERRVGICREEMEPDLKARGPAQAEAAHRAGAAAGVAAEEDPLPVPVGTVYVPTAVKRQSINWELHVLN